MGHTHDRGPRAAPSATQRRCCEILVLLEDSEFKTCAVLERAIELAESYHARLTLAAPVHVNQLPYALAGAAGVVPTMIMMPNLDQLLLRADHMLRQASSFVPASIPVTTAVLRGRPRSVVRRVLADGRYDRVVVTDDVARPRRLTRNKLDRSMTLVVVATVIPRNPTNLTAIAT